MKFTKFTGRPNNSKLCFEFCFQICPYVASSKSRDHGEKNENESELEILQTVPNSLQKCFLSNIDIFTF